MCTSPITITREYRALGIKRSFTVPCGKCAECQSKKRSEIAALSVMEANVHNSLHFFTLTYKNEMLPISVSEVVDGVRRIVAFERGYSGTADTFRNQLFHSPCDSYDRVYSLCREDVKLWLKQCRRDWQRSFPYKPLKFSYLICGELGERRGRPHYHGLFYGLSADQVVFFQDRWQKRFGFSLVRPQPNPADSSGALADAPRVCNYVSKYMFKGVYSKWQSLLPYMEKPRRQSSIRFGMTDNETLAKLSDFLRVAIFSIVPTADYYNRELCLLLKSAVLLTAKKLSLLAATHTLYLEK